LAPLIIDANLKGYLPEQDLLLIFALYVISMGASSRSPALLGFSVGLAGVYLFWYGTIAGVSECPPKPTSATLAGVLLHWSPVVLFMLMHLGERYNRHVAEDEKFWDFQ